MGSKERLQKELDLLLEKIRFWRYVIFAIISGVVGIIFTASQHKLNMNYLITLLLIASVVGLYISIRRIEFLTDEYYKLLDILEKEE
jgi:hypothetical protein